MKTGYDQSTDSLYVELRPLPAKRTVEVEEDVPLDLSEDGEPVGYDIQHASGCDRLLERLSLRLSLPAMKRLLSDGTLRKKQKDDMISEHL